MEICFTCKKFLLKKECFVCSNCGLKFCRKHIYSYVDGNNIAITKNAPALCIKCYQQRHGKGQ